MALPAKKFDFRIGAKDHAEDDPDAEYPENRDLEAEDLEARKEKLKLASVEYQTLQTLDGTFPVLLICILVMVDVSISLSNSITKEGYNFQVFMTIYFIVEFMVRGYCYSDVFSVVDFLKSPYHLIDLLCIVTDVIGLAANANPAVRSINILRLVRIIKAADWLSIIESLRNTRVCLACLGKPRDTTLEDQVAEERKQQLEEMMKYGIFYPTETVEVVNPIDGEVPNEHYTDITWREARVVRINNQGRYTVRFLEDGKYWDRAPPNKVRRDLMKPSTVYEVADEEEEQKIPNTWQYRCLVFQESIPATFLIVAIVCLELFLINEINNDASRIAWGFVITVFFLSEIILRFYTYHHTFHEVSGFFLDIFRIIDVLLVLLDVVLIVIIYTAGAGSDARAIRLIRLGRLLKNARGLKTIRSLRSLKFIYACIMCKLPTTARNMHAVLQSTPWSLLVIAVSIGQLILVSSNVLTNSEQIYILALILALLYMEIGLTIGIHLKIHSDPFAFCKQPVQLIELIIVLAATVGAVISLALSLTIDIVVSYILFFRVVRIGYVIHRHRKDIADCCIEREPDDDDDEQNNGIELEKVEVEEVKQSDVVNFSGNRGVKYADSCIYQGNWMKGMEEGSGQLSFPNGDKYKGNFKRGQKHGRGLFLFENGDQFKGSFVKNRKHGAGTYTWVDGDRFEANFMNGYEHGKATFYSTDGRVVNYFFNNGIEVPTPDEESQKQNAAVASYKGLNFKTILSPEDQVGGSRS